MIVKKQQNSIYGSRYYFYFKNRNICYNKIQNYYLNIKNGRGKMRVRLAKEDKNSNYKVSLLDISKEKDFIKILKDQIVLMK